MKRSEALEKIAKILFTQVQQLDSGNFMALTDFVDSREEWIADADIVLSAVEAIGMSPPHRATLVSNPEIKTDRALAELPAVVVKDEQTWEPENEKE